MLTQDIAFSILMAFYYSLAVVVTVLGVLSLRSGLRFARYVRHHLAAKQREFTPYVSLIAPCKGLDQGFAENISALFEQDYPSYEIIFVVQNQQDPSIAVLKELTHSFTEWQNVFARTVVSGTAIDCGQKVHNLRVATGQIDPKSEVLVFVDSDARPGATWLRSLVAPLINEELGAATGYRWFIPVNGGLWSNLRSVWNASIASALGGNESKNFCWGGSTAIRKSVFEELRVTELWRGTVSDDFTITRILNAAKRPIHFVPACMVPSFEDCTFRELLKFTNRQVQITRVYASHLWVPLLIGSLLFSVVFFGGIVLTVSESFQGRFPFFVTAFLVVIFLLGAAKSYVRFRAVQGVMQKLKKGLFAHLVLWPFGSLLYLFNALVALFSRTIEWRGITYKLNSPTETVIIDRK